MNSNFASSIIDTIQGATLNIGHGDDENFTKNSHQSLEPLSITQPQNCNNRLSSTQSVEKIIETNVYSNDDSTTTTSSYIEDAQINQGTSDNNNNNIRTQQQSLNKGITESDHEYVSIENHNNHIHLEDGTSNEETMNKKTARQKLYYSIKNYCCDFCDKSYTTRGNLKFHMKCQHSKAKNAYSCSLCSRDFATKGSLTRHQMIHTNEKRFSCSICSKGFSRKEHLKVHERSRHIADDGPHICKFCSKQLKTKAGLQTHERIHNKPKPYACVFCPQKFRKVCELQSHVREHGSKIKNSTTSDKPYSCESCYKTFSTVVCFCKYFKFDRNEGVETEPESRPSSS